jgi:hypothetical protein
MSGLSGFYRSREPAGISSALYLKVEVGARSEDQAPPNQQAAARAVSFRRKWSAQ